MRLTTVVRPPALAVLFVTVALDLLGFGMIVPLMPLVVQRFGVGGSQAAWLLSVYALMQFFFAPAWGALSDRIGRRPVLLCSICGNIVALLIFATAQTYEALFISRLIAGVCTANIAVATAYIADVSAPELRAKRMGLIGAAFGLGFVLGPFFAGELSIYSPNAPAFAAAMLGAINFVGALCFLPESHIPKQRPKGVPVAWWRRRWLTLRTNKQVGMLMMLVFAQVCGFAMMEMVLTLFCKQRFGFNVLNSGRLLGFVGLVMVITQGGVMGPLTRRLNLRTLVQYGLIAMACSLAGVALSPYVDLWLLYMSLAFLAFSQGIVGPSLSALVSQASTAADRGATLGVSQSFSALARVLGPASAGLLLDGISDSAPLWVGSCVIAAAASAACVSLRHERQEL